MKKCLLQVSDLFPNSIKRKRKFQVKIGVGREIMSEDEKFLLRTLSLIDLNIGKCRYKLANLAEDLCITERQLFRKIKAYTNTTPNNLIKEVKLQYALQLLRQRSYLTIKEVTTQIGYKNSGHFTKTFQEKFGKHPREFLNNL